VAVQFLVIGAATNLLLLVAGTSGLVEIAASAALVVANLVVWGALFEGKRWAVPLELARLALVPCLVAWMARGSAMLLPLWLGSALLSAGFAAWITRYRDAAPVAVTAGAE